MTEVAIDTHIGKDINILSACTFVCVCMQEFTEFLSETGSEADVPC